MYANGDRAAAQLIWTKCLRMQVIAVAFGLFIFKSALYRRVYLPSFRLYFKQYRKNIRTNTFFLDSNSIFVTPVEK